MSKAERKRLEMARQKFLDDEEKWVGFVVLLSRCIGLLPEDKILHVVQSIVFVVDK